MGVSNSHVFNSCVDGLVIREVIRRGRPIKTLGEVAKKRYVGLWSCGEHGLGYSQVKKVKLTKATLNN